MDEQSTTTPSADRRTATLRHASQAVCEVASALGLDSVAREIESETHRRIANEELRVVVLGEIKHGKSSLINALIGQPMLPVGVTPTTASVVAVKAGDEPGRYELDDAGSRTSVDEERFAALAKGKAKEGGVAEAVIARGGALPERLMLVDTPGLNDIARFRGAISRSQLPRADVLVLVLDATQALTRTELSLLHEALAAVGGLGNSGARLELVINRIDLVPEPERPTIVAHIRKQLGELLPPQTEPFLTNAKAALASPEDPDAPVQAVARLRERLAELADGRDEILPARVRSSLQRQIRLLRYNAAIQTRALQLEASELEAEIKAVDEALAGQPVDLQELRGMIDQGRREILQASHARIGEFRGRLEMGTLAQVDKADLRSLTDVLPGAVQDAFIEFARAEAERLREGLEGLSRNVMRTHGEQARRRLFEATLRLGFRGPSFYIEPPSILIEAGLVVLGVVGTAVMYLGNTVTGLLMTIASPLTTMMLREKSVRDARTQARDVIPGALGQTTEGLEQAIDRVVGGYLDDLADHLAISSAALGEQLQAVLGRARDRLAEIEGEAPSSPDSATGAPETAPPSDDEPPEEATEPPLAANEPPGGHPSLAARRSALEELARTLGVLDRVSDALDGLDPSADEPPLAEPAAASDPAPDSEPDAEPGGESPA